MIIKICGITKLQHAIWAADAGADMLGFVFADSHRKIDPEAARAIISQLPAEIKKVGVFVNEDINVVNDIAGYCGLDYVQLHGEESPDYCRQAGAQVIKAFRIKEPASLTKLADYHETAEFFLLDTFVGGTAGGTGKAFDWSLARKARNFGKIILAGGLNPENVGAAIKTADPFGVDVSTGVETARIKDLVKITAFIINARGSENVQFAG